LYGRGTIAEATGNFWESEWGKGDGSGY
jgi:hypothetical protein